MSCTPQKKSIAGSNRACRFEAHTEKQPKNSKQPHDDPSPKNPTDSKRLQHNLTIKYAGDRFAAFWLVVLIAPVGFFIAVCIMIESLLARERPCVFVLEKRLSAGRAFWLLKFRIFRQQALRAHRQNNPTISIKALERNSTNLTFTGRFLKRCYLDEIPQLLNILWGHMSLVGPRPYFEGDWHRQSRLNIPARTTLRAGLVGPYQAVKGSISGLEKVNQLDGAYMQLLSTRSPHQVMMADLTIVMQSARIVATAKGL